MSLRVEELSEVAAELDRHLTGAVVQKAFSPLPRLCYLELRVPGRTVLLCCSAEPAVGRLSVATSRLPSPPEASSFQLRLRQELVGAKLTGVVHPSGARRVELAFEREGKERRLVAELTPAHPLLVLVGEGWRVLSVWGEPSPTRPLWPGRVYEPPPEPPPQGAPVARLSRLVPGAPAGGWLPLSTAAEALFAEEERRRRADAIRRRLTAPLRARLVRLERTLQKVRTEAGRKADAERARAEGELLAQNLHRLQRGARTVRLTEYTAEGPVDRELALDPARTPREEVERRFHQYRRLLRGVEHATRRLAELDAQRADLAARLDELSARPEAELLCDPALLLPRPRPREGATQVARPYREYASSRGERILVGKGGEGNDQLTFHIARPHDLWLHVRGLPGAHVVIPLARGAQLPTHLLVDAAHLALHHSDAKGEPRGEVSYTFAKFVRRVKGGGPGQVTYSREKTFVVRLEPERLQRLLATAEPT